LKKVFKIVIKINFDICILNLKLKLFYIINN